MYSELKYGLAAFLVGATFFAGSVQVCEATGAETVTVVEMAAPIDLHHEVGQLAQPSDIQPDSSLSAEEMIVDLKDKYLKENGIYEGRHPANKGKTLIWGVATIERQVNHPDFPRHRTLAYERAYMQALQQFIQSVAGRTTTETLGEEFADNSSNNRSFGDELSSGRGKIEAIWAKLMAVGSAQLDKILTNLGVDPAEYSACPPDQKKLLVTSALIKRTVTDANKALGGVSVVQTFSAEDKDGNGAVGVLLVYSDKMQSVADAFRNGRKPAIAATGKPLVEQLDLDNKEKLYGSFGTRLLVDENGPVLVSYGQWGNSYQGKNASSASRQRQAALRQADGIANAQIVSFLTQSFTSHTESEIGESVEEAVVRYGKDGNISDAASKVLTDVSRNKAATRASAILTGAVKLKDWRYKTPEGHEIVGIVKMYSFASIQDAKKVFAKEDTASKTVTSNQTGSANQSDKEYNSSSRTGTGMNLDVF